MMNDDATPVWGDHTPLQPVLRQLHELARAQNIPYICVLQVDGETQRVSCYLPLGCDVDLRRALRVAEAGVLGLLYPREEGVD